MPLFGPPQVEKMQADGNVRGLIKALGFKKDDSVRRAAAEALGQIGDEQAVEPLIAFLGDKDDNLRRVAAEALGKIGDARAVEPLMAALGQGSWHMRPVAAEALGKIGDKRAVEPLVATLGDDNSYLVRAAIWALGQIGELRAVGPLIATLKDWREETREAAMATLGQLGEPAVGPLIAALKDADLCQAAAMVLERCAWRPDAGEDGAAYWIAKREWDKCIKIGGPAVGPLVDALGDKHSKVRKAAINALGQIGDARGLEPLIPALRDQDEPLRQAAAEALGRIGDARAVEPLVAALGDEDGEVRGAAAEALGRVGDARAVGPLVAALKDADMCEAAAVALEWFGWQPDTGENGAAYWIAKREWDKCVEFGASAVGPLIAALGGGGWDMRVEAAKALGQIGAPAVQPLLAALREEEELIRQLAARALGQIGDQRAVEALAAALGDERKQLRREAANALGQIKSARAVEPLLAALRDEDERVRWGAAEALGQIGEPAVGPLIAALKDVDVRPIAGTALEWCGWQPDMSENAAAYWIAKREWEKCVEIGGSAVGPLIGALRDSDTTVREAAIEALGQIGDASAVGPLTDTLKDTDVRQAAAVALERCGWQPDTSVNGALYWVAKREWDKCAELGGSAVRPLIAALGDRDSTVREAAIEALVKVGAPAIQYLRTATLSSSDQAVRRAAASVLERLGEPLPKPAPLSFAEERQALGVLRRLCDAYAANDRARIAELEPLARQVGEEADRRGGLEEMRRLFNKLGGMRGSRTLEMHWGGIGDWWG